MCLINQQSGRPRYNPDSVVAQLAPEGKIVATVQEYQNFI